MTKREVGSLYAATKAVLVPTFRFLWRIEVEGLAHVPGIGGAIVAPNHVSVLDSFFVPSVLPRRITYVGKAEYLDDWKTRYLFPAMGMIAIDRAGGDAAGAALDAAATVLDRGELFGIYPEGTRSRDGLLHKGHTGVARLALRTGAPIIPVGIQGSVEIMPPGARRPRPWCTVRVRFGRPIDVSRYRRPGRTGPEHLLLRQITDEVMFEIRELSGQDYVDEYATRPSEPRPAAAVVPADPRAATAAPAPGGSGGGDARGGAESVAS